jgi:hypothetical protein
MSSAMSTYNECFMGSLNVIVCQML